MNIACRLSILALALLVPFCGVSSEAKESMFSYYENGQCKTNTLKKLQNDEAWSKQGGHQPWRTNPVMAASIMASNLLPAALRATSAKTVQEQIHGKSAVIITKGDHVAHYILQSNTSTSAYVILKISGRTAFALRLEKPFGYGWYVTGVRKVGSKGWQPLNCISSQPSASR